MDGKSRNIAASVAIILAVVATDCSGQNVACADQNYLTPDRTGFTPETTSRLTGYLWSALNWTSFSDVIAGVPGARIVHFGENHGRSEEQSLVAALIPVLRANGFSALFIERRSQHQPAIDDYLQGSSTYDQMASAIKHVENHPGRSVFSAAKAEKLAIIAMDMPTTESTTTEEYATQRDRVMYKFTGGQHSARRPNEWGPSLGQLLDADFRGERIDILVTADGKTDGLEHLPTGLLRKGLLLHTGNSSIADVPLYWDAQQCDPTWRFGDWDYLLPVE